MAASGMAHHHRRQVQLGHANVMLSGNGELRRIPAGETYDLYLHRPALHQPTCCEYISRSRPGRRCHLRGKPAGTTGFTCSRMRVIGPDGDSVILQGSRYLTEVLCAGRDAGRVAGAGRRTLCRQFTAGLCRLLCGWPPVAAPDRNGRWRFHLRGGVHRQQNHGDEGGRLRLWRHGPLALLAGHRECAGRIASRHNDALLPLDELREVDPREAGMIAYMLANGRGGAPNRRRGYVTAGTGRCCCSLHRELSLAEHAERAGERLYAGMDVRIWYKSPATPDSMVRLNSCTGLPSWPAVRRCPLRPGGPFPLAPLFVPGWPSATSSNLDASTT